MKNVILLIVLLAMITPSVVFCQDQQPRQPQPGVQPQSQQMQQRRQELALRESELTIQQKQNEINFQREKQNLELEKIRRDMKLDDNEKNEQEKRMQPILLILIIVNILCGVWVYQDIRKQNAGSGIWIVIALFTGLLGTLVYAVVRLGEKIKTTI
jgi:hypothetical protein